MTKLNPGAGPSRGKWRRSMLLALGLLVIAGLVLAACDSDDDVDLDETTGSTDTVADTGNVSSSSSSGDPVLDFFQCMRDEGLDVSDPNPDGGMIGLEGVDTDDPSQIAIVENCRDDHMAGFDGRMTVGGDGGQMGDNMASTESLIAFVDCMREQGIDMPDPSSDGRLQLPENADPASGGFQAAGQQCAVHLDGGIMMGDGSGGGVVSR